MSDVRWPVGYVGSNADESVGTGSLDGETRGACSGNTIKVKIIDA